ncbi:MAG: KH domain-containing protein [Butyricicoccaceae bacterium]
MVSDQPERQLVAEIIREKMLRLLDREVPHGVAVGIERWNEREDGLVEINAVIYCEKASHKGIIIGKRGAMLKEIGQQARADIERMLDAKVFLELWVKVRRLAQTSTRCATSATRISKWPGQAAGTRPARGGFR